MTFIPAYKPGQQFDSRWREEPPEDDYECEDEDCSGVDCAACSRPTECEGGLEESVTALDEVEQ